MICYKGEEHTELSEYTLQAESIYQENVSTFNKYDMQLIIQISKSLSVGIWILSIGQFYFNV